MKIRSLLPFLLLAALILGACAPAAEVTEVAPEAPEAEVEETEEPMEEAEETEEPMEEAGETEEPTEEPMEEEMIHEIIYIGDPMCSWCWGFAPVLDEMLDRHGQHAELKIIVGGLRPGTTSPMDESDKSTIRSHWEHVNEASGQPFDYAFFDRDGFVYDTEPAARAA